MCWRSIIKVQVGMNVLEKYYKGSRRNECPGEVL
jgi:hypothetical protein